MSDLPPVLPQLRYDDPAAAVDWLCRVFGLVEASRMTGPDGTLHIADLRAPLGARVMISGRPPFVKEHMRAVFRDDYRAATDEGWPNLSYAITVVVPDVDAHFAHARAGAARIIAEPQNQPWGLRDYEAVDLEGRVWNFSQHIRDVQPEDWGARQSPKGE
jgi:uncharacterized glyoxalase superfamily protein PhnB